MLQRLTFLLCALVTFNSALAAELPQTVWLEAETFGPLHGGNFSYQKVDITTKGSWSVAGPGVAAEWTQGGESEWMSVAARADEPGEVVCGRDAEMPAAGHYTLWVRYADYRNKKESFGVRVKQGGNSVHHVFGEHAVIDELDQMKLLWDWSFGWDHFPVDLQKGAVRVELYTTGPTEARRQVDCICLTTDESYHPAGREKPDCAAWLPLRAMQKAGMPDVEALVKSHFAEEMPKRWRIAEGPPIFLWNTGEPWLKQLKEAPGQRVDWPYSVDSGIEKDFIAMFRGKDVPVFGDPLSGPAVHIPLYPALFSNGSLFTDWLNRHADRRFAVLLNYGEPNWPDKSDKAATAATFEKYGSRLVGFVAGESMSYDNVDQPKLDAAVRAAKTRQDILTAIRAAHDEGTSKKFSAYFAHPVMPADAWARDIPCLSAGVEAFSHALADWGVKRVGHENSGNSPTLARRMAFLRGAARQFEAHVADYQSCNLGDASNIFSREGAFYPASSRYILDNQYDAWAGSGLNWVLKDYLLFLLGGADTFYHEEGNDIFWKPGGNSAGDDFPIGLSPRGRVTDAVIQLARKHRVGTQYTPVAFLLDEAHGWAQEMFSPAAFGLDRELNPALLAPGRHEASIRGWFDVAYFPAPLTQNEPATAIRQTYVNGIFGDIFDVIVTAPKRADVVKTYPVLIAAGEVPLSDEWGSALADYLQAGGTFVACIDQLSGPGAAKLGLPASSPPSEASAIEWKLTSETVPSNVFRYQPLPVDGVRVLATTTDGKPLVTLRKQGNGQLILVAVPMGLGIDQRPTPLLSLLLDHLTQGLVPVHVSGDVEWTLNHLDDGSWLVALLNNRGVNKPQHGVNPTDHREAQSVTLRVPFKVQKSNEWITETDVSWKPDANGSATTITVPAGGVRMIESHQ